MLNDKTVANELMAIVELAQRPKLHAEAVKFVGQQNLTMPHGLRQQMLKMQT